MEKLQKMAENLIERKYGARLDHVVRQIDRMVSLLEEISKKLDRLAK